MWSKKDYIIFFAGFETLHTLGHVMFSFSGLLPLQIFFITWTQQLNTIAIIVHAIITIGLLWWASRLKCC